MRHPRNTAKAKPLHGITNVVFVILLYDGFSGMKGVDYAS
jgi:hypothetical protein